MNGPANNLYLIFFNANALAIVIDDFGKIKNSSE